jgi:hypothetical protein
LTKVGQQRFHTAKYEGERCGVPERCGY